MTVLEFLVEMVELVQMQLEDIPVNAFLDSLVRIVKQVRHSTSTTGSPQVVNLLIFNVVAPHFEGGIR